MPSTSSSLDRKRIEYVLFDLAPRIDTVTLLTVEEVSALILRARKGEFDGEIF